MTPKDQPADASWAHTSPTQETWMYDAANEIFVAMGIAPFDNAIPGITGIIAKHYALRTTAPDRARKYLADVAAFVAEQRQQKDSS